MVYIYLYISLDENVFENGCIYIYIYICFNVKFRRVYQRVVITSQIDRCKQIKFTTVDYSYCSTFFSVHEPAKSNTQERDVKVLFACHSTRNSLEPSDIYLTNFFVCCFLNGLLEAAISLYIDHVFVLFSRRRNIHQLPFSNLCSNSFNEIEE